MTSDAATIIREVEVAHPAAKLIVMASTAQESEMGDATNLVLILAGELLKRSEDLLTLGLHPSEVIQGYEMALVKGREELESECNRAGCVHCSWRLQLRSCLDGARASRHHWTSY